MINSFLVTLVNNPTPPVNGSSVVGNVLWPAIYRTQTYTPVEAGARGLLFADDGDYLHTFLTAIQMLFLVESSVVSNQIYADDPRTSYSRAQLLGQFEGVDPLVYSYQAGGRLLAALPEIPAENFLSGDLLLAYRSSLAATDRLAAIIAHFGRRS